MSAGLDKTLGNELRRSAGSDQKTGVGSGAGVKNARQHLSILDPKFHWVGSASTDIRKLFRREQKRLRDLREALERADAEAAEEAAAKVRQIKGRK